MRPGAEGGFAIPVMLMVLLAATALGHLIHYLAWQELAVAGAERDLLSARLAAEGGVTTLAFSKGAVLAALSVGDSLMLDGDHDHRARYHVTAHRLASEVYLLLGEGWAVRGATRVRAGRLTWALDPGARLSALPAAVSFATDILVTDSAAIVNDRVTTLPLAWRPADCAPLLPVAESIFPGGWVAASARWVPAAAALEPARRRRLPVVRNPPSLHLGALSLDDLVELADVTTGVTGGHTRVDMESGCPAAATGRWGTPMSPAGRCGTHFPVIVVRGSLEVIGGQGQGVLVVGGDASFSGAATFAGLVLAAGAVRLSDDVRIAGWIRSGDQVHLQDRARVEASACAGLRALSHGGLQAMRAMPAGSWLGPV